MAVGYTGAFTGGPFCKSGGIRACLLVCDQQNDWVKRLALGCFVVVCIYKHITRRAAMRFRLVDCLFCTNALCVG